RVTLFLLRSPPYLAPLSCFSFSHCSPDHRHLPSFPTRRSSDLCFFCAWDVFEHIEDAFVGTAVEGAVEGTDGCCEGGVERRECGDRKSTRLNSSHVSISYAVFCLKKKTNAKSIAAIATAKPPST